MKKPQIKVIEGFKQDYSMRLNVMFGEYGESWNGYNRRANG